MRRGLVKQKTVAFCDILPKVPIDIPVLRRSLDKSFHKRGPAIQNDRVVYGLGLFVGLVDESEQIIFLEGNAIGCFYSATFSMIGIEIRNLKKRINSESYFRLNIPPQPSS